MSRIAVTRALVSVSDKTGLVDFCGRLAACGVEIVSSGGTATTLARAGIAVTLVSDVTGHPEILGGRVKTLHPSIHGGILADRSNPAHLSELSEIGIEPFQLVVTNLYPFEQTVAREGVSAAEIIEQIDIGGPAMVRAAAKNHFFVGIVTSPDQYRQVVEAVEAGGLDDDIRRVLARAAFFRTAAYDAAIVGWLEGSDGLPDRAVTALEKVSELRYGENPHQLGARYRQVGVAGWWDGLVQHGGMELSYLNLLDVDAAWRLVHEIGPGPAAVIVKHANPCGAAMGSDLSTAYRRAYECDERSAFGGIVALDRVVDTETVSAIEAAAQADVIVAPGYEPSTVERILARRRNTRVLEATPPRLTAVAWRQTTGGWLGQSAPDVAAETSEWQVVSRRRPTDGEWADAVFAWKVCAHVSSNAIVLASGGVAWGIGAGQQNRVEAAQLAASKAKGRASGGASASDAFYPFPDGIAAAAEAGVAVVVQPGGAQRDLEIIEVADRLGMAMVFTGERQFRH
jgi:phosphoribosylaminoimidazolecarboxamide formyltransferase / IMP cyclohydrolase